MNAISRLLGSGSDRAAGAGAGALRGAGGWSEPKASDTGRCGGIASRRRSHPAEGVAEKSRGGALRGAVGAGLWSEGETSPTLKIRTRRLRISETLRRMTRETRISSDSLIYPLFIREGIGIEEELPSLPGQTRYSPDTVSKGIETALRAGVRSFLFFGIPEKKDDCGSGAYAENGVIQQALRNVKKNFGNEVLIITDVCLCEYTKHGHCGLINGNAIDNDATLPLLSQTALSHIRAGSDIVAPSAKMDGAVAAIRTSLDAEGFKDSPIMSYSAKYASALYSPFRDAAGSAPQFGDRKTYQMDYHNGKESLKSIEIDIAEGADMIIVKPALTSLDIISIASRQIKQPIAGYSVSGEYAMIKAAANSGFIDEHKTMCESAVSVFRAGADILITYFAKELSAAIEKREIG